MSAAAACFLENGRLVGYSWAGKGARLCDLPCLCGVRKDADTALYLILNCSSCSLNAVHWEFSFT